MENEFTKINIVNKPEISAIYYSLLCSGYGYYHYEKSVESIEILERFRKSAKDFDISFFSCVKQPACKTYPYWPRAYALESASFYLDFDKRNFSDFDSFHGFIMQAPNISEADRDEGFWIWIQDFPKALTKVMELKSFRNYLAWEKRWISKQNELWLEESAFILEIINNCGKLYGSPIKELSVILNPIKCAYSSDYHLVDKHLFFSLGEFRIDSIIHEYLHQIIHPRILENKKIIMNSDFQSAEIDQSYVLSGDQKGKFNAIEEVVVRKLTEDIFAGKYPDNLDSFIFKMINV